MFGEPVGDSRGMIPRSLEYLFVNLSRLTSTLKDVKVEVSFLEIYCDRIRDLGRSRRPSDYVEVIPEARPSMSTEHVFPHHDFRLCLLNRNLPIRQSG
jgi:hypothetical protein